MDAASRRLFRRSMLGLVAGLASLSTIGCSGGSPFAATFSPSPLIVPDAVTILAGGSQVFTVENANVVRFDLVVDGQPWPECLAIDPAFAAANGIRLVAHARCRGLVFVSASIGDGRSPLVAVMKVQ